MTSSAPQKALKGLNRRADAIEKDIHKRNRQVAPPDQNLELIQSSKTLARPQAPKH